MYPRLVIGGTKSGVGKTTVSLGLMAALSRREYDVQPFKVGPDYIDPAFHTFVTGNKSRNLDGYLMGSQGVKESFLRTAKSADISIIEGVMGLFDGRAGTKGEGSTAEVAKILKAPVILVIDGSKTARSAGAIAYGYSKFDAELNLAGVILNNIGSQRHYEMIKEAIEEEAGVDVLGYIPRNKDLSLPERHLGLVPTAESKELELFIDGLVELIEEHIDLDRVIELAKPLKSISYNNTRSKPKEEYNITLGVAYDKAFNFYYEDNLEIFRNFGVKLKYFSPLEDEEVPQVDGLYLGGGFPESFLAELAENKSMKESLYKKIKGGLPTYAECGGMIYLTEEIRDFSGNSYNMVGIIPAKVGMEKRLQGMGYIRAKALRDNIFLKEGEEVRGHEFHYSRLIEPKGIPRAYTLYGGKGDDGRLEGVVSKNLLASYIHLHFGSNLQILKRFLKRCRNNQVDKSRNAV